MGTFILYVIVIVLFFKFRGLAARHEDLKDEHNLLRREIERLEREGVRRSERDAARENEGAPDASASAAATAAAPPPEPRMTESLVRKVRDLREQTAASADMKKAEPPAPTPAPALPPEAPSEPSAAPPVETSSEKPAETPPAEAETPGLAAREETADATKAEHVPAEVSPTPPPGGPASTVPDRYRAKGSAPHSGVTGAPAPAPPSSPFPVVPPPDLPPASPRRPITTADLSRWFLRGGLVILTIGIAYFARLVVPFLTPAMKVAFAYLGAMALFAIGRMYQEKLRDFARPVMAGGLAIGFFVSNAAYFVEGMRCVPMTVSLAWSACGVASMVWAAEKWKSQAIAGLAIFLGHVAAYISAGDADTFSLVSIAFLSATAVLLFVRNDWPPLSLFAVVAAYASHFLWSLVDRPAVPPEQMFWTNFIFLSSYYAIFVGSDLFWRGRLARGETESSGVAQRTAARAVGPVNLIAYVSFVSFLHIISPGYFEDIHWYFFALGGFQIALGFAHRRFRNGDWSFYPALGAVFLTLGLFSAFDDLRLNLILATEALILLLVAHRTGLWLFRGLAQAALTLNFFHYWFIQTAADRADAGTVPDIIGGLLVVSVYFVKARLEEIWYGVGGSTADAAVAPGDRGDDLPEGPFGRWLHETVRRLADPFRPVLPHAHAVGGALVLFHQCLLHFGVERELTVAAAFLPLLSVVAVGLRSVPLLSGWLTLQAALTLIGPMLRSHGLQASPEVLPPTWEPLAETALGWIAALLPALSLRFGADEESDSAHPRPGQATVRALATTGLWTAIAYGFMCVTEFPPHTPLLLAGWIGATALVFLIAWVNHAPAPGSDFAFDPESDTGLAVDPDSVGLPAQAAAVILCLAADGFLAGEPRLSLLFTGLALVPLAVGLALKIPFLLTSYAILQSGLLISLVTGADDRGYNDPGAFVWWSALPALVTSTALLPAASARFERPDRVFFSAAVAQATLWGALMVMCAVWAFAPAPVAESVPLPGWLGLFAVVVLHMDRTRAALQARRGINDATPLVFASAAGGCFSVGLLYLCTGAAFADGDIAAPRLLVALSCALMAVTGWRRNPALYPAALLLLLAGYFSFYIDGPVANAGVDRPLDSVAILVMTLAIALAKDFAITRLDPPPEGERLGLAEALTFIPYALALVHLSDFLYHRFEYPNCVPAMALSGTVLFFALAPRAMRRGALAGCLLLLGSLAFICVRHLPFAYTNTEELPAAGAAFILAMALERLLARNADFGYQVTIPGFPYPMRRTVVALSAFALMLAMYTSPLLGPDHRLTTAGWAVFGTALIGWALLLRSTLHLRVGTVIVLVSLARVILVDTRNLEEIYKTLAYIFVGVCMIAVAWLFSRFNERMKTL